MSVSPDAMREVIREIVRDVIREVVAEEMAAMSTGTPRGGASNVGGRTGGPTAGRTATRDVHLERGALTERHVREAGDGPAIRIGRTVVITPLARDRARARGIEIIRVQD